MTLAALPPIKYSNTVYKNLRKGNVFEDWYRFDIKNRILS